MIAVSKMFKLCRLGRRRLCIFIYAPQLCCRRLWHVLSSVCLSRLSVCMLRMYCG